MQASGQWLLTVRHEPGRAHFMNYEDDWWGDEKASETLAPRAVPAPNAQAWVPVTEEPSVDYVYSKEYSLQQ